MATNHTTNYNLNLWEANDKFLREEFNENTSKIDTALKTHDSAVAAIQTTLSGMVKLAVGHYTGNGAATRFISTGFTPQAVLVFLTKGYTYSSSDYGAACYGGLAVTGHNAGDSSTPVVQIASGGFNVAYQGNYVSSNRQNESYNYIALG